METTKKFTGIASSKTAPQYDGTIINFKNHDIYEVEFSDGSTKFVFPKDKVSLSLIPTDASGNRKYLQGTKIKFQPYSDVYFKIDGAKTTLISKADADKIETAILAAKTAAELNKAANTAVKSETIKKSNINKTALLVVGSIVAIGLIARLFFYTDKSAQGQGATG